MIETAARADLGSERLSREERVDLLASYSFTFMHLCAIAALFTGISWLSLLVCALVFWIRMFGITAGYHRYFSHRSFKTSRVFQFVLAWLGASAGQNGPLWWASHHRLHHRYADTDRDIHSPGVRGLWWSHAGWILCRKYKGYDPDVVRDLARYPELRFLSRSHMIAPGSLALGLFLLGLWLELRWPSLGVTGWQMLGWGFFISTVLLYHATFLVNSVAHAFGTRRFRTGDLSRNNWWVALVTLGEGWHNNHHRWPSSERQGFYWWEIDVTHYLLRILARFGIVWDLRAPPERIYEEARATVFDG
jgi:stearoyl-CoA desaturase (delta-9 desaturase)